ncbi:hypothetical protein F5887DRAFT_897430 [Amanita rubescens]|nr:hypothetical protein F5887DRAFT_897430 [Amanita rubescens]
MPRPPKFRPRNIPCRVRNCSRYFTSWSGLSNHLRTHSAREQQRGPPIARDGHIHEENPPSNTDDEDLFNQGLNDPIFDIPDDEHTQDEQDNENVPRRKAGEKVVTHPHINGRPCNSTGEFLPEGTPPPPWNDQSPTNFAPYASRESFQLADLLFRRNQMPEDQIDDLLQIWARTLAPNEDPPFANAQHLYSTIDATKLGNIPWNPFTISFKTEEDEGETDVPWKLKSYDVWYRDPLEIIKMQLGRRDFVGEIDFAPKEVRDSETNVRRYQDFMSGEWAWEQADILAKDDENHGATFCPIILGSDKTTVSVATGQNEYYPLYISNGLIHNNVRRAHINGVSLLAFLTIPKMDREHDDSVEFQKFRREAFHSSLTHILESLRSGMSEPEIIRYGDGHYRRTIFGLGPYITDYPEQALLACIVQGWCPKCTANKDDLDGIRGQCTHEWTQTATEAFDDKTLWDDYGIVSGVMPFTYNFPRGDIHETLSPDILHQMVKGTFKDHLVTWIEQYIKQIHTGEKRAMKRKLADIDKRIACAPPFPKLRRFPEGRGYKQWTGDDSKALMKVRVRTVFVTKMVQAISSFMEFCYLVRQSVLDDNDLEKLDEHLSAFHEDREIFVEEGIRDDFSLPRQHSLTHYSDMIRQFGAPNSLCSSITESKHIRAVRKPWRRSSKFNALSQMLCTNSRLDKLEATSVDFKARGMLRESIWANYIDPVPPPPADNDNDGEELDDRNAEAEVKLARKPFSHIPRLLPALTQWLRIPSLPALISEYMALHQPGTSANAYRIYLYPSAIATYYAPSDRSGLGGMLRERIRATHKWRGGGSRYDCVFIKVDEDEAGFRGLDVVQVVAFFKVTCNKVEYPGAIVTPFKKVGNSPCPFTQMWKVRRDLARGGQRKFKIVPIHSIVRGAHLIGISGSSFVPREVNHSNALEAFKDFYVNKFIDYHAHETVF